MKIHPGRTELFHADGRRHGEMTELIDAFRNFANAPNNKLIIYGLQNLVYSTETLNSEALNQCTSVLWVLLNILKQFMQYVFTHDDHSYIV
jgi:hypothetical protein